MVPAHLNISPRKVVTRVNQGWRRPRRRQPCRLPLLLLLSIGSAGWGSAALAGEPAKAPLGQAIDQPLQEPGAEALLDGAPLQVGLKNHGWLEPNQDPPSSTSPIPKASAPTGQPPVATPSAVPTPGSPDNNRLVILDRRQRLLRVLENGKELRRYPVAVGMPGWETPVGSFTVIEKTANPTWEHPASGQLLPPGPENPLGSRWIGFHRDCQGRSGFNGQEHLVVKGCVTAGFHGTPNRSSVGRAVSHGCVRLFDEHARDLFDLVSLGTPVTVLP
jgi:L,D-transpeptidase ErfK/SrfK